MPRVVRTLIATAFSFIIVVPLGYSQQAQDPTAVPAPQTLTKEQKKEQRQKARKTLKELDSQYKQWLNEDVIYIISPDERNAFLQLDTNEEREQFIEAFWLRRSSNPDLPDNDFKEEHYRRIAYANEHFASGIPGWKTDRGRIYIMWGPADEVDSHPSGGSYERPSNEGGGETSTYPFEDWRYRYLVGIGEDVNIEFVDPTMTGEFHLTMDPSEKDALTYVPGAGLTEMESMGLASKTDRFNNTDGSHLAQPLGMRPAGMGEFERLELYSKIQQAPPVKFKDLEAVVSSRVLRDQVKFDYRFAFLRITSDTVLVPITVQIPKRQLTFQLKDGVDSATVNLFARITSLSGRIVQTFEETLRDDTPVALLEQSKSTSRIYQKAVPMSPGLYRLDIVIKDVNSGNVGVVNTRLAVPRFQDDELSASTLILADQIQRVSIKDIGLGQFVIGDVKVRPKLDGIFAANEGMGVFLQVYNLKVDDKTHKADTSVQYRVMKEKSTDAVLKFDFPTAKLPEHGEELTLENVLTLGSLEPGKYNLEVQVTDNIAKQSITKSSEFSVKAAPPVAVAATQGR